MELPQPCVKACATLISTWSGELSSPLWCSWLENKVKPFWWPLWLQRTSPTQTYLLAKEGNYGKQILRLVSSPRGDIFLLPCSYFVLHVLYSLSADWSIRPTRPETPTLVYPLRNYILLYICLPVAYPYRVSTLHKNNHLSYLLSPKIEKK